MAIHYPKTICFDNGNMVLMDDTVVIRCRSGSMAFGVDSGMFLENADGQVFEFSGSSLTKLDAPPEKLVSAFNFAREYRG